MPARSGLSLQVLPTEMQCASPVAEPANLSKDSSFAGAPLVGEILAELERNPTERCQKSKLISTCYIFAGREEVPHRGHGAFRFQDGVEAVLFFSGAVHEAPGQRAAHKAFGVSEAFGAAG